MFVDTLLTLCAFFIIISFINRFFKEETLGLDYKQEFISISTCIVPDFKDKHLKSLNVKRFISALRICYNSPSFEKVVPETQTQVQEVPKPSKRFYAVLEILTSEQKYLENLKYLKDYLNCFQNGEASKETGISKDKLLEIIPKGLDEILNLSKDLINEFSILIDESDQKKTSDASISQVFIERSEKFKCYFSYISKYSFIYKKLQELKKINSFQKYIHKKCLDVDAQGLSLESFLILPVQRLPRYKTLLRAILEHTDLNHSDYENLEKSYELLKKINTMNNQRIKGYDYSKEFKLPENDERYWIQEGEILGVRHQNYYLFNDLLVIKKIRRNNIKIVICKLSDYKIKIQEEKNLIELKSRWKNYKIQDEKWIQSFKIINGLK